MNTIRKKKRLNSFLILPACLLVMLFFGCSAKNTASPPPAPTTNSTSSPSPSPAAAETPVLSPEASPTPFAVNPIYAFYAEYLADCGALLDDYAAGLSALQTAEGLSCSLALTEHRALLSEGRITAGRLYGSDADGYSSTLEAAAEGSGSMSGNPEKGYSFTFSYNDGRTLSGTFSGSALRFTLVSAEGTAVLDCTMEKAVDVWSSTACTETSKTELTVRLSPAAGEKPIQFGRRSGNYLPVIESTGAREEE
ncbi:hypothetical protein MR810_07345 [bacterium]|nr:hypothetical protein [bacterium]